VPPAPAGDEVLATFQLANSVWWKLESLLYKPPILLFAVNDGKETWRFLGGTGPDLHILHTSSNLGYSPVFSPVSAANLEFTMSGGSPSTSGIKIKFYDVPMTAPSGDASRAHS
jgi:hypothetical protein